jgi:small subunit ribosomal protein S1
MPDPNTPETPTVAETTESFQDVLKEYERGQRKPQAGSGGREGTVIAVTSDSIVLDIGFKTEGILSLSAELNAQTVKPGDKLLVTVKGRDPEGYYELVRGKIDRPTDWPALEKAFNEKATIMGTVTGVVKGGLSVDVGVRAFMPASRSGARDAAEMEKLVGEEIRCRITKIDATEEDVVVDRRIIAEEEERSAKERRYSELKEGDTVRGAVRSLADYGAFVDLGGIDGLLHVSDISWTRINKPSDVLAEGQELEVRVLKIDPDKRRISLGMKQLQPHPWDSVAAKYKVGERVRGVVTRLMDFGAFVEIEPGIEGLIHISEMSWGKKVKWTSDVVKPGENVEAVILGINAGERRISLGLKQALGDPWRDVEKNLPLGAVVEGPVASMTKFGAFVQVAEGVEGMIHISEISAEKRINHPSDVLRLGQVVKAQVLAIDTEKRQLRLSIKQLVPSDLDEYVAEHKEGDVVSGRVVKVSGGSARVELGEGIQAGCDLTKAAQTSVSAEGATGTASGKADLSSLGSMLQARWKSGGPVVSSKAEEVRAGEIRKFRIAKLDAAAKKIELELA